MADGKATYMKPDILHPVEEEDDAEQNQQMITARDHVLGAEIDEGNQVNAGSFFAI